MRVLSIDWDYFVVQDPINDWGHREAGLYLETIWHTRRLRAQEDPNKPGHPLVDENGLMVMKKIDLRELAPFVGDEHFLFAWAMRFGKYKIAANESHYGILQEIEQERNIDIINVDAHHDIYYNHIPERFEDVECGSWAGWLMKNKRVRSYHQVYPTWRQDKARFLDEPVPSKWAKEHVKNFKVSYGVPDINWKKCDLVFICRSGCWVPPEYDARFNKFIRNMGLEGTFPERSIE